MKIRPLDDYVVIAKRQTESGIIIPDVAQDKICVGEVLAIGEGKRTEHGSVLSIRVNVGEKVLVSRYAGEEVEIGGEKCLLVSESELIGVVEDD
jgi:chaperonin GroES